jgi:hypothetical protein
LVTDLLQGSSKSMAAVTPQAIKREGSQPTQYQRGQARKVQQVRLVSRLSELSSGRGHRLELDGAEAIRQVYGEDGDKQHNCHRDTGERDKCSDNHSQSSEQLDKNCRPPRANKAHVIRLRKANKREVKRYEAHT